MMQNPQATTNLKVKVVRKIPIEKSQLIHAKMAEGLTPVNKIGSNISNSTQILSSLLQSGSLDRPVTTSSLSNSQTPLLTNASNSEMSSTTSVTSVSPSENLLNHILTGSLTAKSENMGQKSSSAGNVNNKPGESMVVTVPKVKPLLPDGLPESLLSKITLLEMVCTLCVYACSYVCVCMYLCICVYLCISMHVCICIFIHIYMVGGGRSHEMAIKTHAV